MLDKVKMLIEKLENAKNKMLILYPDMYILLLAYEIIYDENYEGIAYTTIEDGQRKIVFGRKVFEVDDEMMVGVILHEVAHNVLKHIDRMMQIVVVEKDEFVHEAYNIAADSVINRWLRQEGHDVPDWELFLYDKFKISIRGKSTEEIYKEIKEKLKGRNNIREKEDNDLVEGAKKAVNKSQSEEHGIVVLQRAKRKYDEKADRDIIMKVADKIARANKTHNELAGDPSSVWKKLVRYVEGNVYDRTFLRPSRRCPNLMGKVKKIQAKELVVAVDTSGSVQGSVLKTFIGTINEIAKKIGASITVISWSDSYVVIKYKKKVERVPDIMGSTFFSSVLRAVEEENIRGESIIVFTDGVVFEEESTCRKIVNSLRKRFKTVILVTTDKEIPGNWSRVFKI